MNTFITQIKAAITHAEEVEQELIRQEFRNQQLEIVIKIIAARTDGKIQWTDQELKAAITDPRCLMLGSLGLELYGSTANQGQP